MPDLPTGRGLNLPFQGRALALKQGVNEWQAISVTHGDEFAGRYIGSRRVYGRTVLANARARRHGHRHA